MILMTIVPLQSIAVVVVLVVSARVVCCQRCLQSSLDVSEASSFLIDGGVDF